MNKFMKTIKISLIFCFLLTILLIVNIPTSSAFGEIYNCQSFIDIEYDEALTKQPLLPIDMTLDIPLTVKYSVEGRLEDYVPEIYENMGLEVFIYIKVFSTPEWCKATVSPSVILLTATPEGVSETINLSVQVNRDTHAFVSGDITIEFKVDRMGAIQGNTSYHKVSFTNGYFPMLNLNTPDGTVKTTTPDDIAGFNLEIENLGNSLTNVSIEILDAPNGWSVGVPSSILIDAKTFGSESKKSVQVSIKPPYSAGYHNERETITLAIKPSYFNNASISGEEYYVTFVIKNKGYSTPGFESAFVIMGLIVVFYISKKRYNNFDKGGKN
jgi:hypothetical protein